jgi:quinol-cytochrome oxidoreductase complex cytochrome b subunit
MSLILKDTAKAALAKYQWQLLRAALPSIGIFVAIVGTMMLFFATFLDRVPHQYRSALGIALTFVVILVAQIPLGSIRRNASKISAANNLICPTCNAPLGDSYVTLKRTGRCRHCGGQVIDAV